jgi:two-component system, NtrC family, response regulator GlrR
MYNALILDHGAARCNCQQCDALPELLTRAQTCRLIPDPLGGLRPATAALTPEIVFLRMSSGIEGAQSIRKGRTRWPGAAIIAVICNAPHVRTAGLETSVSLADEFLFCSALRTELTLRTHRTLVLRRTETPLQWRHSAEALERLPLVGQSPSFLNLIDKISNVARSDATVLISGETGSGKELAARAIHYQSARRSMPFIPVNCGALPDHLFENELFGHVKGAFTDASSAENGLISEAEGGTLFLDEVATLSPSAQVKLLRFLQNGEYRPLGSARSTLADVRVIAATNTDLKTEVDRKRFREDLFYRLNILSVSVPPLRERGDDVLHLAEYYLDVYGSRHSERRRFSDCARQKLLNYPWPGNVRELEGLIQRAVVLNTSGVLLAADIDVPEGKAEKFPRNESLHLAKSVVIGEFERGYVVKLLAEHQGNITHAAKAAGKDRRTLQRLVKKYSLDRALFTAFERKVSSLK